MPQYYKCLEKPVTSKCGHEATGVLAQTIRQYGCELNTDSTSGMTFAYETVLEVPKH